MDGNLPAAKRQKTKGSLSQGAGPSGAAATSSLEVHCRTLEVQNANLKEQLAATQQQLKEALAAGPAQAASGTAKKSQQGTSVAEELVYSPEQHSNFLRTARRVSAMKALDLSGLDRTTSSFGGAMSLKILFGKPQWRSDKKVDAVLAALTAGTDNVQHLDLGDAPWASEFKYAKDLVKLLRKYKKSLSSLRVTTRALVQPSGNGSSQVNAIDIIGAMPNLRKLELVVTGVDNHHNAYAGEFQLGRMVGGNKRPKVCFASVKELELYLTRDWFDQQFGSVDDCSTGDDYYSCYEDIGGGYDETEDSIVPDLLQHRKDIITHLDFTDFKKTRVHLPIEDLFASLTKMRSISVRSEFLHIIKDMTTLNELELHVVGGVPAGTVESVASVLGSVELLEVQVGPSAGPQADALLEELARRCTSRQVMSLVGAGWKDTAVSGMLESGSARLRTLRLHKCAGVQAQHLPLLTSLSQLQEVYLPQRLRTNLQPGMLPPGSAVKVHWE